ncbi:putative E2F-associated phosphoprotein [Helianthus annuus]|nr:putative E2F-associated phosphoprotein [Helianthus annuus]
MRGCESADRYLLGRLSTSQIKQKENVEETLKLKTLTLSGDTSGCFSSSCLIIVLCVNCESTMSQQKEDAVLNESIDSEEKEKNQDQTVEETVVSDDDIIDYSVKPEFYDPKLDDKDQLWVQKKKKGQYSDAVLSCPACFTTLCLECQRHEKYVTQYRAVFVVNCKVKKGQVSDKGSLKRKRVRKGAGGGGGGSGGGDESFSPVCCSVCETEVGVIDDDEIYHFFNVLPSEC